ncbi:MAG: hypothetical protein AABY22_33215 [Nanoarchaeota archaeon]
MTDLIIDFVYSKHVGMSGSLSLMRFRDALSKSGYDSISTFIAKFVVNVMTGGLNTMQYQMQFSLFMSRMKSEGYGNVAYLISKFVDGVNGQSGATAQAAQMRFVDAMKKLGY